MVPWSKQSGTAGRSFRWRLYDDRRWHTSMICLNLIWMQCVVGVGLRAPYFSSSALKKIYVDMPPQPCALFRQILGPPLECKATTCFSLTYLNVGILCKIMWKYASFTICIYFINQWFGKSVICNQLYITTWNFKRLNIFINIVRKMCLKM